MKRKYIVSNELGIFCYSDRKKTVLHREDGPAVEYPNGDKYWFYNNKLHRSDGPAIEWANGQFGYYIHDQSVSQKSFEEWRKK
jgi:hypothetical protein